MRDQLPPRRAGAARGRHGGAGAGAGGSGSDGGASAAGDATTPAVTSGGNGGAGGAGAAGVAGSGAANIITATIDGFTTPWGWRSPRMAPALASPTPAATRCRWSTP